MNDHHQHPHHHQEAAAPRYFNRELSWLQFNRRVLEEAADPANPLCERVKFAAIVSSNHDEFTMVRLAELWRMAHGKGEGELSQHDAATQLAAVRGDLRKVIDDQYRCWRDDLAPALAREGFALVAPRGWTERDRESLRVLYRQRLQPVLTPLAVDPTRPFPVVANRGLTIALQLVPEAGGEAKNALVAVPGGGRLIALPPPEKRWALVEDVVMAHLDDLFPGHRITARCLFRVTRDGALDIDEDQAIDLLSEIEQELSSRAHGHVVRLEIAADADPALRGWLCAAMGIDEADALPIDGPLDLTIGFQIPDKLADRPDLGFAPLPLHVFPPDWEDPFARIRASDILLHHPYQSFQRVVELVERAADDPQVLAIKQTLYRVSGDSPIVRALARAARAGKQVTVLIELKARFDEAANIKWARALEQAGAHVIYGLMGYKVHAKLLMIIRRDEDGLTRYCHLGSGNYNDRTARFYTDLSLFTANEAVGRDVAALFNMLTGYSLPPEWERLAVAPLTLRSQTVAWLHREIEHAKAGRGGRVIAKFNSLVDEAMCEELYKASQAGVEIDLIVRGMCILRPGVPGLSETIRVRSLVGRLLEHSRIYHFANAGDPVYAIASADWMTRNLDRRVECLTRIEAPALCARLQTILDICLEDNVHARLLNPDGTYRRLKPAGAPARSSMQRLVDEAATWSAKPDDAIPSALQFKPARRKA
jgi:polyphosphate kinase